MDDAKVTMAAFNKLFELARELPLEVVTEIVRLSEPLEWDANWIFQEVLKAKAKEGIQAKKTKKQSGPAWFDDTKYPPLDNPEKPIPLNVDEVASVLEYGGPFSQYFETFEQRPEQVDMLRAVTNALSYGSHLMVEAEPASASRVSRMAEMANKIIRAWSFPRTRSTCRINSCSAICRI
jgi:DNA polymerase-3 subunit epsilon/ATP-dependent DNA helicase DinG